MMSRWPLVTGSKEPGQATRRTFGSALISCLRISCLGLSCLGWDSPAGWPGRTAGTDGALLLHSLFPATVPKAALAMAALLDGLDLTGPGRLRVAPGPFHHDHAARHQPPVLGQGGQHGADGRAGH